MNLLRKIAKKVRVITKRGVSALLAVGMLASLSLPIAPKVAAAAPLGPVGKVSFTFDDGLDSALTYADPILKGAGFTGTDFVISNCVGMTTVPNTCHANTEAKYMTWAQVNQLKNDGWEIGNHTADHACLASGVAQDPEDCTPPYGDLTPAQVNSELVNSQSAINAQTGSAANDFATPYGDWTPPVLAEIAKVTQSHRGFADSIDQDANGVIDHGNTYPYNDYLLYDYQVQGGVSVAQVKSIIDQTKASNQWLVLTFHDVLPNASSDPSDYQYSTANFQQIVDYVKTSGMPVVNVNAGLVTNAGNLLSNSSFDTAISSNIADATVWSTDAPANIKQDTGDNGSYPGRTNSVLLTGTTRNVELFSPQVPVDGTKTYVIKNYLNVAKMAVATGHEIAFYVDEYNVSGTYLQTQFKKSEVGNAGNANGSWVEDLNFEYKPTSTNVNKARLQVVVTANSAAQAYLDNVQWFAEDGSTGGVVTLPVTPPVVGGSGGGTTAASTSETMLDCDQTMHVVAGGACAFPDNYAINGPGGRELWQITGDGLTHPYVRRYFTSPLALYTNTNGNPIFHTLRSVAALNNVAQGSNITIPEHVFFRDINNGQVFWWAGNDAHLVMSPDQLSCMGGPIPVPVPEAAMLGMHQGSPATCSYEGLLLRGADGSVWSIQNGQRHYVMNMAIANGILARVASAQHRFTDVSNQLIASIPAGSAAYVPYGSPVFVRYANDPTVWLVSGATRRHALNLCSGSNAAFGVRIIPQGEADGQAVGANWTATASACNLIAAGQNPF